MNPNFNFPSSRKFSMTEIEGKYLRRKTKKDSYLLDWFLIFLFLVGLFVLGITVERLIIDPALHPFKAEAAETDESYCQGIKEGKWTVLGATEEEIKGYCDSLKDPQG